MLWTKNPCSGKPLSLGQFSYFVVPPQNWLLEFSSLFLGWFNTLLLVEDES
jgi:hypothetical protein